jgi:hypothetical protein
MCAGPEMNLKPIVLSLLLFASQISFGRQQATGDTIVLPQKISRFISKGYSLIDTAMGDLNLDRYKDVILVLKTNGEDTAVDATEFKRPLLLLLGHADGTFTLAARNDNVISCRQCGGLFGDPYTGIEVKKGTFIVHHFGGSNERWSNDITFKYSQKDKTWLLYEIVDKGWSVFHLDKVETTIQTKKDFGVVTFDRFIHDE